MFQKFNTESMLANFIKYLLETTDVPTLQCIDEGSPVISGCTYKYKDILIRANTTQRFNSSNTSSFTAIHSDCTYSNFISNVSRYDSETHKHLGRYLRYLRYTTGLNLMNYYNCYSGKEIQDIYLRSSFKDYIKAGNNKLASDSLKVGQTNVTTTDHTYSVGKLDGYRIIAVPVLYDTKYTVALSCPFSLSIRGIIYDHGNVSIDKTSDLSKFRQSMKDYYSDYLDETFKRFSFSDFNHPFTFEIPLFNKVFYSDDEDNNTVKRELYSQQRNLYMLIQIPNDVKTSIVVLEQETISDTPLSLLHNNTGTSYAFSDRLAEYLMLNVINSQETLPGNVSRCNEALNRLTESNLFSNSRIWNDSVPHYIKELLQTESRWLESPFDHDGNINKDVEQLLSNLGVYIT